MLGQAKPFASLSSGLLARKGQAKPAMRPQGFNNFGSNAGAGGASLDDLGWNDMGEPVGQTVAPAPVVVPVTPAVEVAPAPPPAVLVVREALKDVVEAPVARELEPVVATPAKPAVSQAAALRIAAEGARGGKAAFTLRLDTERHLRLRLASAVAGRSSQQIVTQALDAFLDSQPAVEELARQLDRAR